MLPRFEIVARRRPVDLIVPGSSIDRPVAPFLAVEAALPAVADPTRPATVALTSEAVRLEVSLGSAVELMITTSGGTSRHSSRRHGRPGEADALALTLTGNQLTALTREDGAWVARGRVDLRDRIDLHDPALLAALSVDQDGVEPGAVRAGRFGQFGLRDLRVVTRSDGTPYPHPDGVLLTATSAGPGHFDTAHTSVWLLDPDALTLQHRADLFFTRPDRPGGFGDHATHLLRHEGRWLVATSTWAGFRPDADDAHVEVTLAETDADVTAGVHVLETRPLPLPTDGFASVGVWDPHLIHTGEEWLVAYVSARRFFAFHPVLARGLRLDRLRLAGAQPRRRATEGVTLHRIGDDWRVLASDGRDGRRGQRERYPVFDLALDEVGELDAPYPTNIPWPTLLERPDGLLMIGFNGARYGGRLVGYGSHGAVVFARSAEHRPG